MSRITLVEAFGLSGLFRSAVVGSGGKTSLLFRLARACIPPVVVSNSAHLAVEQGRYADQVITVNGMVDLQAAGDDAFSGVSLFTGPADARGRSLGLSAELLASLAGMAASRQAPLLIEADGSRGLPLKAPAEWEPPLPGFVDSVIVAAGMSGVGKPLSSEWVYRPEDYSRLAGLALGAEITAEAVAGELLHPGGGLKNIPPAARRMVLLNQADTAIEREAAERIAQRLLTGYQRVIVASLHGPGGSDLPAEVYAVYQKTAGIVLAAGSAQRMGQPKQLLAWQGEPLVRRQVRAALEAGLDPVILVSGAYAEEVGAAVTGLKLRVVNNGRWQEGQSSSLKAGLAALGAEIGAVVFLLADQPFIQAEVIRQLVAMHSQTLAPVIAPRVGERRANPVLFDRSTFSDLANVQGDSGGRQVMAKWGLTYVDWPDERLLLDIDNLEDYRRALDLV